MEEEINVNELCRLLGCDEIKAVWVASLNNQHKPRRFVVGYGGVLSIVYKKGEVKNDG